MIGTQHQVFLSPTLEMSKVRFTFRKESVLLYHLFFKLCIFSLISINNCKGYPGFLITNLRGKNEIEMIKRQMFGSIFILSGTLLFKYFFLYGILTETMMKFRLCLYACAYVSSYVIESIKL